MLSFDERGKLLSEAIKRRDAPVEINCTGVPLDKIRNVRKVISAEILNKKTRRWEKVELTEYLDSCPICGKLMMVTTTVGSTWIAACCEEHTMQTLKELEKGWYDQKDMEIDNKREKRKDNTQEVAV